MNRINHHAPAADAPAIPQKSGGAFGIPELRPPIRRRIIRVNHHAAALLLAGAAGVFAYFSPYIQEEPWKLAANDSVNAIENGPGGSGTAAGGETLPALEGISYYDDQWALENKGNMQRVMRFYESGSTGADGTWVPGGWREWVEQGVSGIDIGAWPAWNFYEQSGNRRQVTVAIIDSGVDVTHPDLQNSIWVNEDEMPGDGVDNDGNGYIDDVNGWNFYNDNGDVSAASGEEHGTHGAGTIAAAWDGQGISDNVKEAIRYAEANGADICNMSMGTSSYDPELEEMIRNSSMLFVVASGNGDWTGRGVNLDETPVYPAAYSSENIISVGNLMFDGSLEDSSNYGAASVDIAAPGTHILSTIPGGYGYLSGTSMSAPMVSGAAALIYSCRTDLDLAGVRNAILETAAPLEDLAGRVSTGGMLDVGVAVNYGLSQ